MSAMAEVYIQRNADCELTKQYVSMKHVFANARRRINEADTNADRREVL